MWVAPAGVDQRSAARELLVDLATTLLGGGSLGDGSLGDGSLGDGSLAGGLLGDGLADGAPVLRHEPGGRPCVDGLAVSISHSRDLVAVAASAAGPVGVDVEDVYPREIAGLARRWFDPSELEWMAHQPDQLVAFLHLWTAKEAVGKALGLGLRNTGLRRRMPLPESPDSGRTLRAGLVPSADPGLAVVHLPVDQQTVVALALPATVAEVALTEHHGEALHQDAALRRTVRSRTSFPVVVRGS
ncbi:hypothetical protein GCM10009743_02820 [Kribbella swartbergensis]